MVMVSVVTVVDSAGQSVTVMGHLVMVWVVVVTIVEVVHSISEVEEDATGAAVEVSTGRSEEVTVGMTTGAEVVVGSTGQTVVPMVIVSVVTVVE